MCALAFLMGVNLKEIQLVNLCMLRIIETRSYVWSRSSRCTCMGLTATKGRRHAISDFPQRGMSTAVLIKPLCQLGQHWGTRATGAVRSQIHTSWTGSLNIVRNRNPQMAHLWCPARRFMCWLQWSKEQKLTSSNPEFLWEQLWLSFADKNIHLPLKYVSAGNQLFSH